MKNQEFKLENLQMICQTQQPAKQTLFLNDGTKTMPEIILYECGLRESQSRKNYLKKMKIQDKNWIQKITDQDGDCQIFQCKKYRIGAKAKDGTVCILKSPELTNGICSNRGGVQQWYYQTQRIKIKGSGKYLYQDYFTQKMIQQYILNNSDKIKIYEKYQYTLFLQKIGQQIKRENTKAIQKLKQSQNIIIQLSRNGQRYVQMYQEIEGLKAKIESIEMENKLGVNGQKVNKKKRKQEKKEAQIDFKIQNQKCQKDIQLLKQVSSQIQSKKYGSSRLNIQTVMEKVIKIDCNKSKVSFLQKLIKAIKQYQTAEQKDLQVTKNKNSDLMNRNIRLQSQLMQSNSLNSIICLQNKSLKQEAQILSNHKVSLQKQLNQIDKENKNLNHKIYEKTQLIDKSRQQIYDIKQQNEQKQQEIKKYMNIKQQILKLFENCHISSDKNQIQGEQNNIEMKVENKQDKKQIKCKNAKSIDHKRKVGTKQTLLSAKKSCAYEQKKDHQKDETSNFIQKAY